MIRQGENLVWVLIIDFLWQFEVGYSGTMGQYKNITHGILAHKMDGQLDGQTDGWMERWMDGLIDGLTDGWMDRRMDKWTDG